MKDAEHIHIWQLDDNTIFFEGHILVSDKTSGSEIKSVIRSTLAEKFQINHSTIELNWESRNPS